MFYWSERPYWHYECSGLYQGGRPHCLALMNSGSVCCSRELLGQPAGQHGHYHTLDKCWRFLEANNQIYQQEFPKKQKVIENKKCSPPWQHQAIAIKRADVWQPRLFYIKLYWSLKVLLSTEWRWQFLKYVEVIFFIIITQYLKLYINTYSQTGGQFNGSDNQMTL